jgi:mRNA-degrading endonuclease RelE of RelBE toxin-antitoxin system
MRFEIEFREEAIDDLRQLKASLERKIMGEIEKQLVHQPEKPSKNKKCLENESAGFEFEPPLWELRVGEYRVFYDVDETLGKVIVRAIRQKRRDQRTKDILQ